MTYSQRLRKEASEVSDKGRKAIVSSRKAFVPLKLDPASGDPISNENFDPARHIKELNLDEIRFLNAWRKNGWDTDKAAVAVGIEISRAAKIARKVTAFKQEDDRIKAMADIPTPEWIAAKHTENVSEGRLDDSQRDSLKELAKITGAYKQQNIQIQTNVFNLPPLEPEQEKKLKEVFDAVAMEESNAA